MEKALGKVFGLLLKNLNKSQKEVSSGTGISTSQINRFLKGKNDLSTPNLLLLLEEVGIDLKEIILKKTKGIPDDIVTSEEECVLWLLNRLDKVGRQTYVKSLAWAYSVSSEEKIPKRIQEFINQKLSV